MSRAGLTRLHSLACLALPCQPRCTTPLPPAQEALRLHQLRHQHIVGFVGVSVAEGKGIILMELCEGRDLHSMLPLFVLPATASSARRTSVDNRRMSVDNRRFSMEWSSSFTSPSSAGERVFGWYRRGRHVAYDIARGLNYLHAQNVVHMDIKSCNVLLTSHGAAKLADVGFSRILDRTCLSDLGSIVGTFAWWVRCGAVRACAGAPPLTLAHVPALPPFQGTTPV